MRACRLCGQSKLDREFYADPANTDGRKTACKACLNEEAHTRYWNNVEAERARARLAARKRRDRERRARAALCAAGA